MASTTVTTGSTPTAATTEAVDIASAWRRYAVVRIGFGLIWAIDATLKWLPGFRSGFAGMVHDSGEGQPAWLGPWFRFWIHLTAHSPSTFAVLTALAETAICLSLLLGLFQRMSFAFGIVFSLLVWGIGEGFGGPYTSGATDIGCAVMYAVVFAALWIAVPRVIRATAPGLDRRLAANHALRWATFH